MLEIGTLISFWAHPCSSPSVSILIEGFPKIGLQNKYNRTVKEERNFGDPHCLVGRLLLSDCGAESLKHGELAEGSGF